jgi:hypothetical protein
VAGYIRPSSSP